ncbi:MAG: efflux transporter outer membrane subunit [Phycisphaerales bacterium]
MTSARLAWPSRPRRVGAPPRGDASSLLVAGALLGSLAATAPLGGCKVGPDYATPIVDMPGGFAEARKTFADAPPQAAQLVGWWQTFGDATLEDLVVRAIGSNLDLRIAQQRVFEARGLRRVVAADFYPQISALGSFDRSRQSENVVESPGFDPGPSNVWDGSFDANWELDVFGRTQRAVEAASADIKAAEALQRDTLVTLVAEVARNYAELRGFQRRLELAAQNAAQQRDSVALTDSRYRAGLTSELDVAGARAQLSATEAALPLFRQGIAAASHRLGVLVGEPPEALVDELAVPAPIPVGPSNIDPGPPEELLQRRPDLRRAQELAAAACARIGVATSELYPRFFLLGSVGLAAQDFSDVFESASRTYSFGPSITWKVFDGGRIRGNIAVEDARFEQAQLAYRRTVLTALEEVENALAAHRHDQESERLLADAVESNQLRVALATDRYERGIGDFLSVLDAQRALTIAEDDLARTRQDVAIDLISLYKALGGV